MELRIEKLTTEALTYPKKAAAFEIKDDATVRKANEFLLGIKGLQKKISDTFDPIIEAAHKAHKKAIAQKKEISRPLVEAEMIVKPKIGSYLALKERQRREAEEAARIAAEKAERIKKEAEEAALKAALKAEEKGDNKAAEQIIEEATLTKTPEKPLIPGKMKLEGTYLRKSWKWEVEDLSKIPEEFIVKTVDNTAIDAVVKRDKEKTKIPGIRVFLETKPITKVS